MSVPQPSTINHRPSDWLLVSLAALSLVLLSGCKGQGKPWDGIGQGQLEELLRQRNLGLARLEEGQFKPAAEAFTAISRTAPNLAFGYGNLAVADLGQNLPAEALSAAQEAQKRLPDDPHVLRI